MAFQHKLAVDVVRVLASGPASIPLPPSVTGITFRYVARHGPRGPTEFARRLAPQLAYANPRLPFSVERFFDPRESDTNSKGELLSERIRKNRGGVKVPWEGDELPPPELHIDIGSTRRSIDIRRKNATQILAAILKVAEGRYLAGSETLPRIGDGSRDATGTPDEASAANESMAGASARTEIDAGVKEAQVEREREQAQTTQARTRTDDSQSGEQRPAADGLELEAGRAGEPVVNTAS